MKALKPSHRDKRRYVLIKGNDIDRKNIEKIILEFIGVLGYAEASPEILKSLKNETIMSVNRDSLDKIRASFLISGKDINIVRVSGSIKKLKKN